VTESRPGFEPDEAAVENALPTETEEAGSALAPEPGAVPQTIEQPEPPEERPSEADAGADVEASVDGTGPAEHAPADLDIPDGCSVVEGVPEGNGRSVAVVVSRFNGEITNLLLESALGELEEAGVTPDSVTVVPVPGAFELPLAAMAFAKTRRYACVIALGCVIRGETPHFDFVAGEAASGLQLAALETGIPVAFGVLTCETTGQAQARIGKAAEAVRSGLEMADLFAQLRALSTNRAGR
jgi:6,7-dimethyl-8-ribityllumazine synthase